MGLIGTGIASRPFERRRRRRMGLGLAGDALGVETIGLAWAALPTSLSGARRADIAHVMALTGQVHGGVPAEPAGTLDPPTGDRAEPQRPRFHRPVPICGYAERRCAQHPPRSSSTVAVTVRLCGSAPNTLPTSAVIAARSRRFVDFFLPICRASSPVVR